MLSMNIRGSSKPNLESYNRLVESRTPNPLNIYEKDKIEGNLIINLKSEPSRIYLDMINERLETSNCLSEIVSIFGVTPERAEEFHKMGCRRIEHLSNIEDLNRAEVIGIRYHYDLIQTITEDHVRAWNVKLTDGLLRNFKSSVYSFMMRSRDHGVHSRIEVLIETDGDHRTEMINVITEYCDDVISIDGDDKCHETITLNHHDQYTRYKCISRLTSFPHVILDITIYDTSIEPYPKFREFNGDIEKLGVVMTDAGIKGDNEDNIRMWMRMNYGSDKPKSLEELMNAISSVVS